MLDTQCYFEGQVPKWLYGAEISTDDLEGLRQTSLGKEIVLRTREELVSYFGVGVQIRWERLA